jgi:hypothetical protein
MDEKVKEISTNMAEELVRASKPQANWHQFVKLVIDHYKDKTNSLYGWVLYDFLDEKGLIEYTTDELKFAVQKGKGNANRAKSFLMDILITNKKFTHDQLMGLLNA